MTQLKDSATQRIILTEGAQAGTPATGTGYLYATTGHAVTYKDEHGTDHALAGTSDVIQKSTLTTAGDLIVAAGSANPARLGLGTAGYSLIARAGTPAWEAQKVGVSFVIGDNASAITTGIKGEFEIPWAGSFTAVRLLGGTVAGTIAIDLWKQNYAGYPPLQTNSICGTNVPTISGGTVYQDTGLAGWTTSFAAGDIIAVNVGTASAITRCTVALTAVRT